VIRSFRHKGLQQLFERGSKRGIRPDHARKLAQILDLLDAADVPGEMNFAGSFLHSLKGDLKGFFAVRASGNWRVIFRMEQGDAFDVDYIDYH
jgi:toxin HigB-1